jgi:hypothetical protein
VWRITEDAFADLLERLDALLDKHEPVFAVTLNPPATQDEIDALRAAVRPHEIPQELEMIYRWHNGQADGAPWWPLLDHGPLLSIAAAIEHRDVLVKVCEEPFQWSEAWFPITHASWAQLAVQLSEPLKGLVIRAGFPDPPAPVADDLTAVMQAVCIVLDAGLPLFEEEPRTAGWEGVRQRNRLLTRNRQLPFLSWRHQVELDDLAAGLGS